MSSETTISSPFGSDLRLPIDLDHSATEEFYKSVGDPLSTPGYKSTDPLPALWEGVAKGDDPKAMVMLGEKHLLGLDGLAKDENRAAVLFIKAADLNDKVAMIFLLWVALATKDHLAIRNAVVKRIKRAAKDMVPEALYSLGMMYYVEPCHTSIEWKKREKQAKELFRQSAHFGNPFALVTRIHVPKWGSPEYTKKMARKEERCKNAIALGNAHGYFGLSVLAPSFLIKKEYLQKGAEAGDLACMDLLAQIYLDEGEETDKAVEWYKKCVKYNSFRMKNIADILFKRNCGSQACACYKEIYRNALFPEWIRGDVCNRIAAMYKHGCGDLAPNLKRSVQWLERGAELVQSESIHLTAPLDELIKRIETGSEHVLDRREASRWRLYQKKGIVHYPSDDNAFPTTVQDLERCDFFYLQYSDH